MRIENRSNEGTEFTIEDFYISMGSLVELGMSASGSNFLDFHCKMISNDDFRWLFDNAKCKLDNDHKLTGGKNVQMVFQNGSE